jgi:Ni/Co efflux regulator RcnB
MNPHPKLSLRLSALALAALFAAGPVLADKPSWAGGGNEGKHGKHQQDEQRYDDDRRGGVSVEFHFDDRNRRVVQDYYAPQVRSGHCPPGLAKKNNGCLPPGQAKKWGMGRPLPRDVERYPLPRDLLVRLPMPPAGHEYVRVASDILMIAVGTGMVVDAIQDIGR